VYVVSGDRLGNQPAAQRSSAPAATQQLDTRARAVIRSAQDPTVPVDRRAIGAVRSIINTYYPTEASLVRGVIYDAAEVGLSTSVATGPTARGVITVGRYFVDHTDLQGLARRVLQVDHELEHVRQHRQGLGGPGTKGLREFSAFSREALKRELPGTGRVSHSTRVSLIDAALGNYHCLSAELRRRYSAGRTRLIVSRTLHVQLSGRTHPPAPTSCRRSS
jgi:hypothetical protein